jgi:uncharacterized membrane protein YgcG
VTHRRVLAVIGIVWILSALISFLPIQLGWHRPHHDEAVDSLLTSSPFVAVTTASASASNDVRWNASLANGSSTSVTNALSPQPIVADLWSFVDERPDDATSAASETCILDLSPQYAVISSMVSFFLPCFAMMFFYVNLHRYARRHAQNIKKSNRFVPSPSSTTNATVAKTSASSPALLPVAAPSVCGQPSSTSSSPATTRRHRARGGSGGGSSSGGALAAAYRSASEHKAAITLGIIMGVFLFCWVPFFTINVIAAFCRGGDCIPKIVFGVFTWLGYLNSTMNPVIYSVFNRQFRDAFKRVLNIRFRRYANRRSSSTEGGGRSKVGWRILDRVCCCCCNCDRARLDSDGFGPVNGNGGRWSTAGINGSTPRRYRCDGRDAVAPSMSYDHVTASTYVHNSSSCRDVTAGCSSNGGMLGYTSLQTTTTDL